MSARQPSVDETLISQLLPLVPEPQRQELEALLTPGLASPASREAVLQNVCEHIDWDSQREHLGMLLNFLLPLEQLVPEVYHEWRPIIRAAVAFLGTHLSLHRLLPKLISQLSLPADCPLEHRLVPLLAQMPTLQKLGQVIARNPRLDAVVRTELTRLENSIADFPPPAGQREVEQQLAEQIAEYAIDLANTYLAEASVSVVIPFTWTDPGTGKRTAGVFKVLKPYIPAYLAEELRLLDEFTQFLARSEQQSVLSHAHVQEVFADIRHLIEQEINFPQEQANLQAAAARYASVGGVHIPRLLPTLSTDTITATAYEPGVKVTAAFPGTAWKQRQLARDLTAALLLVPLFAPDENVVFHADPHAGNLLCDENSGTLILLDWALTVQLSRLQRRYLLLLTAALGLRDEELICQGIATLSLDDFTHEPTQAARVRQHVARFLHALSPFTLPGIVQTVTLLDQLALTGVRFPAALVIFRKVLFTLEGVVHDIAPEMQFDTAFGQALLSPGISYFWRPARVGFLPGSLLSLDDWLLLQRSALCSGYRLWQQLGKYLAGVWARSRQGEIHDMPTADGRFPIPG
ncbi:MAG: AarF/UbiB family protein [Candidatus Binatia bacterium]